MFRLCRELKIADPLSWIETVKWETLAYWLAYYSLEPWGEDVNDIRASWSALEHWGKARKIDPDFFSTRPKDRKEDRDKINQDNRGKPISWWTSFSAEIKSQHEAIQASKRQPRQ